MSKSDILLEIEIVTRLLDGMEYFDSGLCRLNLLIFRSEQSIRNRLITVGWLDTTIPKCTYSMGFLTNAWSWKPGAVDPRWYWLKDKLKELKNKLEQCT